ncbi:hypothetical protein IWX90DRAFT_264887 [Phyllosticta citrichinensis]|uniref:Uncharacterized protein n=1 Tax=Phyllosticta citrichinensis TaxID=1130410 RepID=A0ABR1XMI1_9PEZI
MPFCSTFLPHRRIGRLKSLRNGLSPRLSEWCGFKSIFLPTNGVATPWQAIQEEQDLRVENRFSWLYRMMLASGQQPSFDRMANAKQKPPRTTRIHWRELPLVGKSTCACPDASLPWVEYVIIARERTRNSKGLARVVGLGFQGKSEHHGAAHIDTDWRFVLCEIELCQESFLSLALSLTLHWNQISGHAGAVSGGRRQL